jgi:uncharacterized protein YmfQ (DUF2313 family)
MVPSTPRSHHEVPGRSVSDFDRSAAVIRDQLTRSFIMKFTSTKIALSIATMSAALLASPVTQAAGNTANRADGTPAPAAMRDGVDYSDRARMKDWSNEKEQLQSALRLGQNKAYYTQALAQRGYQVTSINSDKPDAAEYEVVKGNQTYEVQLDFDKAGKASKVDVTTNMWRSDATEAAMKGERVPMATRFERGNEAYSDRTRMQNWTTEKDRLEQALAKGNDKGFYADQLKKMGYQVTSVNDREQDYIEYEVVKGDNSYEVQIDFDNGRADDIDVTTNVWKSDATERALSVSRR